MKLFNLAFRSTLMSAMIGTIYFAIKMSIREPYGELTPPWGIIMPACIGGFWTCIWCITPKKWWK